MMVNLDIKFQISGFIKNMISIPRDMAKIQQSKETKKRPTIIHD